jgi:hypothetical protein
MSLNDDKWAELQEVAQRNKIKEVLEKQGFDPEDIGRISRVNVSAYQTVTKDEDGNATVHDLEGVKFVIHPAWDEGPQWEIVRPADPVNINLGWLSSL